MKKQMTQKRIRMKRVPRETVEIRVKTYEHSRVRSYFPNKGRLCAQDGFLFRKNRIPSQPYGIISADEVSRIDAAGYHKIGYVGAQIIRAITSSRLSKKLVEGRITSSRQLDVEFKKTSAVKIDNLLARAIGAALEMRSKIVR